MITPTIVSNSIVESSSDIVLKTIMSHMSYEPSLSAFVGKHVIKELLEIWEYSLSPNDASVQISIICDVIDDEVKLSVYATIDIDTNECGTIRPELEAWYSRYKDTNTIRLLSIKCNDECNNTPSNVNITLEKPRIYIGMWSQIGCEPCMDIVTRYSEHVVPVLNDAELINKYIERVNNQNHTSM